MFAGKRLKILRTRRHLRQNDLSDALGFERIYGYKRIGQYEREQRHPKGKNIAKLARLLRVDPSALMIPDVPNDQILIQLFFAMEDEADFSIHKNEEDGYYFTFGKKKLLYLLIEEYLAAWYEKKLQLQDGQITPHEYDEWRYNFPESYYRKLQHLDSESYDDEDLYFDDENFYDEIYRPDAAYDYDYFSKYPEDAPKEYLEKHPELSEKLQNNESE